MAREAIGFCPTLNNTVEAAPLRVLQGLEPVEGLNMKTKARKRSARRNFVDLRNVVGLTKAVGEEWR
jgi:hypothetical protein